VGEHLLCKQGVVGSNPTVSISVCLKGLAESVSADARRGWLKALWAALAGGDTSETRPWALSGILEREPGGVVGEHVLSHGEDDQLCV
jgi:hypothetical protein